VVLGNAFQKKTQKAPKQEIEKALKIMEEYQNELSETFSRIPLKKNKKS